MFWGLLFLVGAVALIVGEMGYLEGVSFWTILMSVALAGVLVDGIFQRNFGMILFSLAFLLIVNDDWLGLEAITPWPVLGAALLGTIGLSILFPNRKWNARRNGGSEGTRTGAETGADGGSGEGVRTDAETTADGEVWFSNSLGESVKYLTGVEIRQVHLKNSFGSMLIYFDNAIPHDGAAEVFVQNSFGSMELFVPKEWKVLLNVETAFGNAEEKGNYTPAEENTLRIQGNVSFGDLQIHHV